MSEYQYFEFQALDRPLTAEQQAAMRRISHRVELTPTRAAFTYTAGSFGAEPKVVLAQHFDAMAHLTGWGDKRIMFRFPAGLVDLERVRAYGDPLERHVTWSVLEGYAVLDIYFPRDEGAGWLEAERWLSALVPLRSDILRGDFRVLYLAWLKSLTPEDAGDPVEEAPVPAGLRELSPQLEAFLELFEVDPDLLHVAVEAGDAEPDSLPTGSELSRAVAMLPREECDAFLMKVAQGEPLTDIALLRRLREITGASQPAPRLRRTTAQLLAAAGAARLQRQTEHAQVVEARRIAELEDLAARQEQAWALVDKLISRRQPRPYAEAVELLVRLRDAAGLQGQQAAFDERMASLCQRCRRRRGLIGRLRYAGLCV
jgi:hypothetical protein